MEDLPHPSHVNMLVHGRRRGSGGISGSEDGGPLSPVRPVWRVRPYRSADKEDLIALQTEAFHEPGCVDSLSLYRLHHCLTLFLCFLADPCRF